MRLIFFSFASSCSGAIAILFLWSQECEAKAQRVKEEKKGSLDCFGPGCEMEEEEEEKKSTRNSRELQLAGDLK